MLWFSYSMWISTGSENRELDLVNQMFMKYVKSRGICEK